MAGEKLIRAYVAASTIMEVVIAMVIIIAVFGTSLMIYTNVSRRSPSYQKIEAEALLKRELMKVQRSRRHESKSIDTLDFRIQELVKPYSEDTLLQVIYLTAYDANAQKLAGLQKVILK